MLKNTILSLTAGITTILACGPVCAQNSTSVMEAKKTTIVSTPEEKQEMIKLSEAFGHFIGRNLHTPGMDFDLESIIKGMREGVAGKPAPMSDQEYEALLGKVQEKAVKALAETNLKAANDYIIQNKSKPNVKEIEEKLQYTILEEGNGATVVEHNTPLINYSGAFIDGTVFSSSKEAGGPITIPLDQTIPGFSKGIVGMKEGEKRRLFVHPDLGYGTAGQLPPNSMLIFDIEVIKADNKDKPLSRSLDDEFDEDHANFIEKS